jgi:hypothetical protein
LSEWRSQYQIAPGLAEDIVWTREVKGALGPLVFGILSGGVWFSHEFGEAEDWILDHSGDDQGTTVWMKLHNHTSRRTKKVFDQYTSGEDFGFTKTVVPVRLARYGDANSSRARRPGGSWRASSCSRL